MSGVVSVISDGASLCVVIDPATPVEFGEMGMNELDVELVRVVAGGFVVEV
ncbi:hypothetical protein [Halorientalis sp. IM1011]|uniref:hypothetical protein n=1 Tax=Halorientalis sp. IM1011 TaxID=1932360 RepID=UPI0012F7E8B1|nr:hypothetical protein [Halorientalis sp. IM1011]